MLEKTTIEELYPSLPALGNIVPFNDWVIVCHPTYKGTSVRIYEVMEEDVDITEAELELRYVSAEFFEDQGHGLQWAFLKVSK